MQPTATTKLALLLSLLVPYSQRQTPPHAPGLKQAMMPLANLARSGLGISHAVTSKLLEYTSQALSSINLESSFKLILFSLFSARPRLILMNGSVLTSCRQTQFLIIAGRTRVQLQLEVVVTLLQRTQTLLL